MPYKVFWGNNSRKVQENKVSRGPVGPITGQHLQCGHAADIAFAWQCQNNVKSGYALISL